MKSKTYVHTLELGREEGRQELLTALLRDRLEPALLEQVARGEPRLLDRLTELLAAEASDAEIRAALEAADSGE